MSESKGRFVWYDVMTTDVAAAKAFYTEVFGWKTQQFGGDESYTMFCVGERPIGGVMMLPDEAKQQGAPPHWIGYVSVADVDATAARAAERGGKIYHPGTDIPEVGRFAVIGDPQGAAIALFAPNMEMSPSPKQAGDFTWHELNTTDYEAAWEFYSDLFGWNATEAMDMGPDLGKYFMFEHEGAGGSIGGMSNVAKTQGMPPHWLYYATVDDLDAALARIQRKGGKVINGPMEVPGGDKVAQCVDPQGCAFALHWRNV